LKAQEKYWASYWQAVAMGKISVWKKANVQTWIPSLKTGISQAEGKSNEVSFPVICKKLSMYFRDKQVDDFL
jgi:hypothetical protein